MPPPPLSARRAGLAPGVDEVLGRALAKAPGDRYASCREFAEALREALALPGYDRDPGAVPARAAAAAGRAPGAPEAAGATVIGPARAEAEAVARGGYPGAARDLDEALGSYRDISDRAGEAEALNEAGTLHRVCGDLRQAGSCHQQALDLARQIGSAWDEAHALAGLGRCALAAGHTAKAADMLRQALEIFQRTGAAEAADVARELGALIKADPTG